ncbi:WAS/WASL-interacting protein family member 1-like [Dermochelys coriacea]|uniref:WAS/WASL-interacting protein family member 1-like n=1 Tax=Dermochelys coriacea TaxID=27794 RepID=UPI001CA9C934|nr:WAS/WASL-interacting protein family member 1-like [Dermochelys coriacea]
MKYHEALPPPSSKNRSSYPERLVTKEAPTQRTGSSKLRTQPGLSATCSSAHQTAAPEANLRATGGGGESSLNSPSPLPANFRARLAGSCVERKFPPPPRPDFLGRWNFPASSALEVRPLPIENRRHGVGGRRAGRSNRAFSQGWRPHRPREPGSRPGLSLPLGTYLSLTQGGRRRRGTPLLLSALSELAPENAATWASSAPSLRPRTRSPTRLLRVPPPPRSLPRRGGGWALALGPPAPPPPAPLSPHQDYRFSLNRALDHLSAICPPLLPSLRFPHSAASPQPITSRLTQPTRTPRRMRPERALGRHSARALGACWDL